MKPSLLLIDLQNDFLNNPSLCPASGEAIHHASRLLDGCRENAIPIIHVWTSVKTDDYARMSHWKETGRWICVEKTEGHDSPHSLQPSETEKVIHKTVFSPFVETDLGQTLSALQCDTLILSGVHTHSCIRATALDAYQRGYKVIVAEDAVASDNPLHASMTRQHLEDKGIRFVSVDQILNPLRRDAATHRNTVSSRILPAMFINGGVTEGDFQEFIRHASPARTDEILWDVPICGGIHVAQAVDSAKQAGSCWRNQSVPQRVEILRRLTKRVEIESEQLVRRIVLEVGKPITEARAEVKRGAALLKAVIQYSDLPLERPCGPNSLLRYRPLGVIACITPWNNPLAIPLGKIAPALLYGNTVVWKPAPAGSAIAHHLLRMLMESGCPPGVVNLVCGDRSTAVQLMLSERIDAVTVSGSLFVGYTAQEICTRRNIPLQAELGGNNAAIVWSDCNQRQAVSEISAAAFGFAGQRCTANRRVVVDERCYEPFLKAMRASVSELVWGEPADPATQVGPLISLEIRDRVEAVVLRAESDAVEIYSPHRDSALFAELMRTGAYYPPTVICSDDPTQEIVQEETFGPVLVIQKATDWDHAVMLCNGVKHGLVSALFSESREFQSRFLDEAQAGILKLNVATAGADAESPFGGWKASGTGPPEHGVSDREFYTQTQTVYRAGMDS